MSYLLLELPIGLDLVEVLWHLLNFFILLIGIRFLIYNPVKKIIDKRKKEISDIEEKNAKMQQQALQEKMKYEELVRKSQSQIVQIAEEAASVTNKNTKDILEKARAEAKEIIKQAKSEARKEIEKVTPELQEKSSGLAVTIAEKILERKVTEKDMDKLIDECLIKWSD